VYLDRTISAYLVNKKGVKMKKQFWEQVSLSPGFSRKKSGRNIKAKKAE